MNTQQRAVIALIKSSLIQQPQALPADFSLEDTLALIQKHHMTPMICDGAIRCGISPRTPAMQELFRQYLRFLRMSEDQQKQIGRVREAFLRENIDFMLLKGSRMKALYPKPELRYMGDADILIRLDQYDRIRTVMEGLGFEEKGESDHELLWKGGGLNLELHKYLIPSYNADLFAIFGDGWKLARPCGGSEYEMRAEDEWIYLFTHFAKHYRDGGIGCRYVADLWVWRRAHPDMAEDYIRGKMRAMGIERFYDNMLRLLEHWFQDGPGDDTLEIMTEFIFASGSWGGKEAKLLSQAVRNARRSAPGPSGRLWYLLRVLFPPAAALEKQYPLLKKHPWLLPAVWVVRPFHKLFTDRRTLDRQRENLQTLSEENIRLRRDMLHLVGLDFRS